MPLNLKQHFQNNLLAIISLAIAITALSYNSWRNEQSEDNRTQRLASFEIMRESAYLQLLIDTATYSKVNSEPNLIQGWVRVNLMVSLAQLVSPNVHQQADNLKEVWSDNWSLILDGEAANKKITQSNLNLMTAIKTHLKSFN